MVQDQPAYRLNALLGFTMTLMHELMHAFFVFAGHDRLALGGPDWELRLELKAQWHELGWEYEKWLSGQLYMEWA
jgi:hypothetical protein